MPLSSYFQQIAARPVWRWHGRVIQASGQTVVSEGPLCSVGDCCEIVDGEGQTHVAEVIGFRGPSVVCMPLAPLDGIRFGDKVIATGCAAQLGVGEGWLGRVMDGSGTPLDGLPSPRVERLIALHGKPPAAMERVPITQPLSTGVCAIDSMLTTGRGQRMGIFGGSGVGKSTLIGMMTRNTAADVTVVGLVGERGREVREFLRDSLGEEGMQRSVTVVSTSDESPLLRMRAALAATAMAEYFAAKGKHVLLVLDSLTRYAMAAREVGIAAGEPPSSKGYTPSVFSRLAQLVERAGNFNNGSVTGFYTVLMEGDDQQDPVADAVRSLLDGHIVLSRQLASEGVYPPIHLLDSLSRLMPSIVSEQHRERALQVRRLLGNHARSADMVRIGAYQPGSDLEMDAALRHAPALREFFQQGAGESRSMQDGMTRLLAMDLRNE